MQNLYSGASSTWVLMELLAAVLAVLMVARSMWLAVPSLPVLATRRSDSASTRGRGAPRPDGASADDTDGSTGRTRTRAPAPATSTESDPRQAITEALGTFHSEHVDLLEQTSASYDRKLDTLWNTAYQALMHDDFKAAERILDQARDHVADLKGNKAHAKAATARGSRSRRSAVAEGKDATTAS